ncbi:hypothetical protein [Bradyrhizobium sp.]
MAGLYLAGFGLAAFGDADEDDLGDGFDGHHEQPAEELRCSTFVA